MKCKNKKEFETRKKVGCEEDKICCCVCEDECGMPCDIALRYCYDQESIKKVCEIEG